MVTAPAPSKVGNTYSFFGKQLPTQNLRNRFRSNAAPIRNRPLVRAAGDDDDGPHWVGENNEPDKKDDPRWVGEDSNSDSQPREQVDPQVVENPPEGTADDDDKQEPMIAEISEPAEEGPAIEGSAEYVAAVKEAERVLREEIPKYFEVGGLKTTTVYSEDIQLYDPAITMCKLKGLDRYRKLSDSTRRAWQTAFVKPSVALVSIERTSSSPQITAQYKICGQPRVDFLPEQCFEVKSQYSFDDKGLINNQEISLVSDMKWPFKDGSFNPRVFFEGCKKDADSNAADDDDKKGSEGGAAGGSGDSKDMQAFYALSANDIDGQPINFEQYRGKVVLVTNVASQ